METLKQKRSLMNRSTVLGFTLLASAIVLGGCSAISSTSSSSSDAVAQVAANSEPFTYDAYAEILETYVDDEGFVDYLGLQQNRTGLDRFNASIGAVSPETYNSWSEDEQLAFLINAYNSFTLQSIIDQDPLKSSIRDIPGVWRIRRFSIAGESKTLDNIEHQTIRVDFNEPRIHAAVNCSAISCPVLRREPFNGENLDQQLEEQTARWLLSSEGIQINRDAGEVRISALFDWFGEDWVGDYSVESGFDGSDKQRAALNFISQYISEEDAEYLQAGGYRVRYLDYNWALNDQ
ncbi:MAG: DUF547 domain-containing protein [Cyanobacteria bacterium J06633_2]